MSPLNITQPLGNMVYNGYYKVMSNIPKMGHLPIPVHPKTKTWYDTPSKIWTYNIIQTVVIITLKALHEALNKP